VFHVLEDQVDGVRGLVRRVVAASKDALDGAAHARTGSRAIQSGFNLAADLRNRLAGDTGQHVVAHHECAVPWSGRAPQVPPSCGGPTLEVSVDRVLDTAVPGLARTARRAKPLGPR
jgi:hypothetical protein